jgi:hypothetical protein
VGFQKPTRFIETHSNRKNPNKPKQREEKGREDKRRKEKEIFIRRARRLCLLRSHDPVYILRVRMREKSDFSFFKVSMPQIFYAAPH